VTVMIGVSPQWRQNLDTEAIPSRTGWLLRQML